MWDAAKAVLWGECIGFNAYISKEDGLWNSYLSFHFKKLEKEKQTKSKVSGNSYILHVVMYL